MSGIRYPEEFKIEAVKQGTDRGYKIGGNLFMIDEKVEAIEVGEDSLKMAVSKIPMDDWTALLESGWGNIESTHFFYA